MSSVPGGTDADPSVSPVLSKKELSITFVLVLEKDCIKHSYDESH